MITTPTNLDIYIPVVRMRVGDVTAPYRFTDTVVRTALVNGVKLLLPLWDRRYYICDPDMRRSSTEVMTPDGLVVLSYTVNDYDVFRNPKRVFASEPPPIVEQSDTFPIIIAASILCRQALMTSDVSSLASWRTPDFSYQQTDALRHAEALLKSDYDALNAWFKRSLGKPIKMPLD